MSVKRPLALRNRCGVSVGTPAGAPVATREASRRPLTTRRSCWPSRSTSKKKQPQPSVWRVARPMSEPGARFDVLAVRLGAEQAEHLAGEVGHGHGGAPGPVEIDRVDAHPGAGPALLAERHAGLETQLGEGAVAVVAIELVRLRVVGDEDVGPAVLIVIEQRDAERLRRHVEEAGLGGDVVEGAVAFVAIEPRRAAAIGLRRAVALRLAVDAAEDIALRRPLHVVADQQIEAAVLVVVEPHRRRAERAPPAEPGLGRDVGEFATAEIAKEAAAADRGEEHVGGPVVVVIAGGDAHAVLRPGGSQAIAGPPRRSGRRPRRRALQARSRRGFSKAPAPVVLEQPRVARSGRPHPGHDDQILIAVAVDVHERGTRAHRLGEVLLAGGAVGVRHREAGSGAHVRERDAGVRPHHHAGGQRGDRCDDDRGHPHRDQPVTTRPFLTA